MRKNCPLLNSSDIKNTDDNLFRGFKAIYKVEKLIYFVLSRC